MVDREGTTQDIGVPSEPAGIRPMGRFAATMSLWLLVVYLGIVLPLDRWAPALSQRLVSLLAIVVAFPVLYIVIRSIGLSGHAARERLKNITLLCSVLLVTLLVIDVASAVYLNLSPRHRDTPNLYADRDADRQTWLMEMLPKIYYPSGENYFLYKPSQAISGYSYGESYSPRMLRHPLLKNSVLQRYKIDYVIDEQGFRNRRDAREARIFTLGDSFCFGYHVTQGKVFQELLSGMLGQVVYNLGVSGTSPWQQYLLLKHLLKSEPAVFHPKHLLWLVYEGNDLEEDYSPFRPTPDYVESKASKAFRHTLVDTVFSLPERIREQSLLRVLTTSQLVFRGAQQGATLDHYVIDGDRLAFPLYRSSTLGYKLFRPVYLERATRPASYVSNHPNAPRLREAFRRMRDLSSEYGFQVTVAIAPSEVRLYKDSFEDFPAVSKEPFVIQYFIRLSEELGFAHINLNDLMMPYAKTEMLYHRDDTHWNERGHEVVATVLAKTLPSASNNTATTGNVQ